MSSVTNRPIKAQGLDLMQCHGLMHINNSETESLTSVASRANSRLGKRIVLVAKMENDEQVK